MENQQALFVIICLIMGAVGYSFLKDIFGTRTDSATGTKPPEPDIRTDTAHPETVRPGGYPAYYHPRDERYYRPGPGYDYPEFYRPPERRNGQRVELILDLLDAMERRRGRDGY